MRGSTATMRRALPCNPPIPKALRRVWGFYGPPFHKRLAFSMRAPETRLRFISKRSVGTNFGNDNIPSIKPPESPTDYANSCTPLKQGAQIPARGHIAACCGGDLNAPVRTRTHRRRAGPCGGSAPVAGEGRSHSHAALPIALGILPTKQAWGVKTSPRGEAAPRVQSHCRFRTTGTE